MSDLYSLLTKEPVNVVTLNRIYSGCRGDPAFASDAMFAMRNLDNDLAWRAAWLLRRLGQEQRLSDEVLIRIAASADEMANWIARLNLCQLFSLRGCPKLGRESLFPFLVECFSDKRAMLRACAISALASFADDTNYRREVLRLIRRAHNDSASSVRARLRHIVVPNQLPDPTSPSVTPPAGAGIAPSVAADYWDVRQKHGHT